MLVSSVAVIAQDELSVTVDFDTRNTTARELLDNLGKVESVHLSYNEKKFNLNQEITLPAKNMSVKELLDILAEKLDMEYQFHGKQIILKQKSKPHGKTSYTVSGHVRDEANGETLVGATVQLKNTTTGAVTNLYGYYSLTLPQGDYTLVFTYIGYKITEKQVLVNKDITLSVELAEMTEELREVVITTYRPDDNVAVNRMSYNKLEAKKIQQVPALFGEADPLKVIKLLPGVSMTGELSSNYSVRGGGYDQNLVLLDEAVVYNPSHLMGIFSTFNNDAVKNMEFYKGNLPARYGGRLSSFLNVQMKDGNNKRISGQGGVSLLASRLTLEMPTLKNRGSLMVSGRRSYADVFFRPFTNEIKALYFYDFNLTTNLKINENNKVYFSAYRGRDVFSTAFEKDSDHISWGNFISTFRWNHSFNKKLFSNLSLSYSKYDYKLGQRVDSTGYEMNWKARLQDCTLKMDFDYFLSPQHTVTFGLSSTLHVFNPGAMSLKEKSSYEEIETLDSKALEHAAYLGTESKLLDGRLMINPGLRLSVFQNVGAYALFNFNDKYEVTDSTNYKNGDVFNTFINLEPRLVMTYRIANNLSLKGGYARSVQYLQLASNTLSGTPLDVWVPSTPNVKPQKCDQYSIGLFQNLFGNKLETSVEVFYKDMKGQIDFKDDADVLLNKQLEGEFRFGKGSASGIEFMLSKPHGKLNGWISYTYSKSIRKIEGVNDGYEYLSAYDRPHNLAITANYQLSKRLGFSSNWVWFSGRPFTPPALGKYYYKNTQMTVYSKKNSDRIPDYMRLDLSLTLKGREREGKKLHSSWNFSVYNVLNRLNPASISLRQKEKKPEQTEAVMQSVLPIMPSVAWIFHF